jgi:anoctamin-1
LTYYRRPVTQRVRDIGVWYRILDSIGKLSVITNVSTAMGDELCAS